MLSPKQILEIVLVTHTCTHWTFENIERSSKETIKSWTKEPVDSVKPLNHSFHFKVKEIKQREKQMVKERI